MTQPKDEIFPGRLPKRAVRLSEELLVASKESNHPSLITGEVQECMITHPKERTFLLTSVITLSQLQTLLKEDETNCILCNGLSKAHFLILGLSCNAARRMTRIQRPRVIPASLVMNCLALGSSLFDSFSPVASPTFLEGCGEAQET